FPAVTFRWIERVVDVGALRPKDAAQVTVALVAVTRQAEPFQTAIGVRLARLRTIAAGRSALERLAKRRGGGRYDDIVGRLDAGAVHAARGIVGARQAEQARRAPRPRRRRRRSARRARAR